MNIVMERPDTNRLMARLRDSGVETEVIGWNPEQSASNLLAAIDAAEGPDGYGECFWPEPTGHFWWMFKRDDRTLETVVLWSRSSAVGWQHVFRASDEIGYVRELVHAALVEQGLAHP